MLSIAFVVIFVVTGRTTAMNENDWIDAVIIVYSNLTKSLNHRNSGSSLEELYTADSEVLFPGQPVARKEDLLRSENGFFERYHIEQTYIGLAELIFSSDDVAIARSIEYPDIFGGGERKANGLHLIVRKENQAKIKLTILNFS